MSARIVASGLVLLSLWTPLSWADVLEVAEPAVATIPEFVLQMTEIVCADEDVGAKGAGCTIEQPR